jgi:hypothetical protein
MISIGLPAALLPKSSTAMRVASIEPSPEGRRQDAGLIGQHAQLDDAARNFRLRRRGGKWPACRDAA